MVKKENVDELLKKNEEQEKLINELNSKNSQTLLAFEQMQKQLQEMQSAFIKMQSSGINLNKNNVINDNEQYEIGCRLVNGVLIYSPKREIERRISYKETIFVNGYEMEMLLKSNFVRDFLAKGVLYFVNEENYKQFNIYEVMDISDKWITNTLLNLSSEEVIETLNKVTRNKKDDTVVHSIFYRIVELYKNGDGIRKMDYETLKAIEKYFNYKIDNAIRITEELKKVM
jgi:uncharacterized coiled-coil protein SlyX